MKLIDSHCHLYLPDFKGDIGAVIQRATLEGVEKFFLPAIDSNSFADMISLEIQYPDKCISMMGLHPCSVKNNYKEELMPEYNKTVIHHSRIGVFVAILVRNYSSLLVSPIIIW